MTAPVLRRIILFLLVVAILTWLRTLDGAVACALGFGFALYVWPSLERWTETG